MSDSPIRRIGILTGGGDCPGLNAVIRAVTKTAIYKYGLRVFGIEDGFRGLIEDRIGELTTFHVSGILTRGGTILGTENRCNPLRYFCGTDAATGAPVFKDVTDRCIETLRRHALDAIIVIGGDGTMTCAAPFVARGVRIVGVPKTIDNDIPATDITFGFLTAVATATEALDRLHSTAASHHRVIVCEVMGRNSGWIALSSGVASGSDVILMPEIPYDIESICSFVRSRMTRGRGFSIVVAAEGAAPRGGEKTIARHDPTSPDPVRLGGVGECIARDIEARAGIETRTTVLGHIQRGGTPIAADRLIATQFGYHAVETLMRSTQPSAISRQPSALSTQDSALRTSSLLGRLVVRNEGVLGDVDLQAIAGQQRLVPPDHPIIAAARAVRTCFGDE
jgi:6-phosphofructokinase 1